MEANNRRHNLGQLARARSGEPGRHPARPALTRLKALHVPKVRASNSLFGRGFDDTESNRVGHIDSIVLQVCYGKGHRRPLHWISDGRIAKAKQSS
jgi:hypothetical protein